MHTHTTCMPVHVLRYVYKTCVPVSIPVYMCMMDKDVGGIVRDRSFFN